MMEANYLAHGCCLPPHEVNWNLRAKVVAGQRHFYERGTFRFRNASCPVPAQELLSVVLRSASPSSQRSNPHQRDSGSADHDGGCNPSHARFLNPSPLAPSPAGVRPAASPAPTSRVSAAGTLSNPAVIFPTGPQQTWRGFGLALFFPAAQQRHDVAGCRFKRDPGAFVFVIVFHARMCSA